ncbi:MAG: ComEA family DNA-binding protein [bacterium]|nr:ComEA family DNA-binding protein [bacterium]
MEFSALVEKYFPFIQKNLLPIILGAVGLIFLSYGVIAFLGSFGGQGDILFESANGSPNSSEESHSPSASAKEQAQTIIIDVEGGVVKPGVYKLPKDSRVQDAFIAAGGLSFEADREWVAKNINLATKLADGAKLYVPKTGESVSQSGTAPLRQGFAGQAGIVGTININTASESELDSLPGVGPATVDKIISGRPYGSIEELLEKKVVGQKVFENIKDKISLY